MSVLARRAILAWLLLLAASTTQAQETPKERRKAVLEGTHVFRRILYDHNLTALGSFRELSEDPKSTILIVLGNLDRITEVPEGLKSFVENGGAVLLASDRRPSQEAEKTLLEVAGVSISGEHLLGLDRAEYYKEWFCPFIRPLPGRTPALFDSPPGRVHNRVATNLPSYLIRQNWSPPGVRNLATLPFCVRDEVAIDGKQEILNRPLFMVGGDLNKGRVLVLADHSVFINEMMLPEDNMNVEFTIAAVRWLRGDGGQRKKVLLVEDQGIQTKLDIPLKSARINPEEVVRTLLANRNELAVRAEETLDNLQRQDFFNEMLVKVLERIGWPPERLARFLLLLATVAVLLYGIYRLGSRGRFRHATETPLLATAAGRSLPAAPLVDQRVHTLLRLGNLNEPAARLAARWFERQGLPITASDSAEPPVAVAGGWWRRRRLSGRLRRLWRLAHGWSKRRVLPASLWSLQRELEAVEGSRKRGEWQTLAPRGSVA
jgi:hypothetical protein